MDPEASEPLVDVRAVRFELAVTTIVLLGGYVFRIIWVIPGLAIVLALAVGLGPRANLFRQVFRAVTEGRIRAATATEPEAAVRFSELFAVAVLSLATLLVVIGLTGLAWLVALIQAGIGALHATTGLSVEATVRERFLRRR